MIDADLPGEARFDPALGAWVLSRHADVSAALRDPRLAAAGGAVRESVALALAPERLAAWRAQFEASAIDLAAGLPEGVPVDLVGAFARPWSASLAARATGAPPADAGRLDRLARDVFLAAAHATDSGFPIQAQAAVAELAGRLQGAGASAGVQAYVALSQTLPCVLAGAWLELLRDPAFAHRLRDECDQEPASEGSASLFKETHPEPLVDELLRRAGPSRAVFRTANAGLTIGRATIARGDRVILRLAAANHDPARFPGPGRDAAGHLAFGRGEHACPGAPLIRMAVAVATGALLNRARAIEPAGAVEWIGGFAIRGPATLPVVLRRGPL